MHLKGTGHDPEPLATASFRLLGLHPIRATDGHILGPWAGRRAMTTSPTARERLGSVARHIDPLGTTLTFTLEAEGGRQEQGGCAV